MSLLSLETKEGRGRLGDAVVDWCQRWKSSIKQRMISRRGTWGWGSWRMWWVDDGVTTHKCCSSTNQTFDMFSVLWFNWWFLDY